MNEWKIKDMIKKNKITFIVGDEVILFRRKKNGYPRGLKYGETYIVKELGSDFIVVGKYYSNKNEADKAKTFKVHRTYIINKSILRDIKIESLLND